MPGAGSWSQLRGARTTGQPYITLHLSSWKEAHLPHVNGLNERGTVDGRMGLGSQADLERVVTGVWGLSAVRMQSSS